VAAPIRRYSGGVRVGVAIAAVALGLASGAGAIPPPNVHGTVVAPLSAACPPGDPCDPRPVGMIVTFMKQRTVVRVLVRRGAFAARLAPGRWIVGLAPPPLGGVVVPHTVLVPRGKHITLRISVKRATA
jgi:hypothetical protein